MSRRTFIKQWNPAVPIGGRGRGRKGKKGGDPDKEYLGGIRTLHDPSDDPRRKGAGRDGDGSTRFYSASGLTVTGLPAPEDRFRAQTLPSTRGGKRIQQRVGMFRNAIQSNVIFGSTSERVLRTSRKKIERILAPESDVPESVHEWRRSPARNTQRRRDAYEYESEAEDEEEMEEAPRFQPRRRISNTRRLSDQRKDPNYDPYEFRDDDSQDDGFPYPQPVRPRRTNSRITAGPSSSRAPLARERLRGKDERTHPRRLFGDSEDEEMEEYDRRPMTRRADDRQDTRMEKRASKRPREMSPPRPLIPPTRSKVSQRHSHREPFPPQPLATPAQAPQSSVNWLREQAGADDALQPTLIDEPQYPKGYVLITNANYTPAIAMGIARRILSGLPRIRLKDDDGAESYLTASRSIIADALERFTTEGQEEGGDGEAPPPSEGAAAAAKDLNPGAKVLRELMNRTQLINITEESEDEEEGSETRGRFENIFSRHAREDSPILERLFNKTMREANNPFAGDVNEEVEVDTAKMLGLDEASEQQPGRDDVDPFDIVPRTSGQDSGASSGSNCSALSSARFARRSMADSHRTLALLGAQPPPKQQLRFAAGSSSNRSSDDYSSERSRGSRSRGGNEKHFPFQMDGIPTHSTMGAPPSNFDFHHHNNNDGSFNFEF